MEGLFRYLGGYLLVELSGYSPERLLNFCSYHKIDLWDLVCVEGKYRFYVRAGDFKQMVGFVRKSKSRLIVLEKHGLPFFLRRHRRRKLFVVGIGLCLFLLYLLSLRIWDIDFDGNSYFTDELLLETLSEQGYIAGMEKRVIVCDDLEMMLRETYPEITWVSAQIRGTRLLIQIRENTGILTVEPVDETPCDLVAACDGVIQEIITRSGTPLVAAGDTVEQGQVLVSGVVELYNDSKEKTGEHLVKADATILAAVESGYEDRFSLEHPIKLHTGRKRYRLHVWVFEQKLSLDGNIWGFEVYDTTSEQGQLILGEDFSLPVRWQMDELEEYVESSALYSESEAKALAEAELARFLEGLEKEGAQIEKADVRTQMINGECVTLGTLSLVREIGEEAPISGR